MRQTCPSVIARAYIVPSAAKAISDIRHSGKRQVERLHEVARRSVGGDHAHTGRKDAVAVVAYFAKVDSVVRYFHLIADRQPIFADAGPVAGPDHFAHFGGLPAVRPSPSPCRPRRPDPTEVVAQLAVVEMRDRRIGVAGNDRRRRGFAGQGQIHFRIGAVNFEFVDAGPLVALVRRILNRTKRAATGENSSMFSCGLMAGRVRGCGSVVSPAVSIT